MQNERVNMEGTGRGPVKQREVTRRAPYQTRGREVRQWKCEGDRFREQRRTREINALVAFMPGRENEGFRGSAQNEMEVDNDSWLCRICHAPHRIGFGDTVAMKQGCPNTTINNDKKTTSGRCSVLQGPRHLFLGNLCR